MHPEPRRRSRHSGERYVLAGKAGQNMISFSAGYGRRNSARRALPGESVGAESVWGPLGLFYGRCPDLRFSGAGDGTERGMDTLKEATHAQSQPR